MNYKFENLGIIEFADIEVKGLTVITGLNDTGKSFLGKAIFSITKTINRAERIYASSKIGTINQLSTSIFQLHRQWVPFTKEKTERFHPRNITNIVYPFISQESPQKISDGEIIANINKYVDEVLTDLKSHKENAPQFLVQIDGACQQIVAVRNRILEIFQEKATKEQKNTNYFNSQIIQGFFQGQINSLIDESTLDIEVKEGVNQLIHAKVKGNKTEEFNHSQPFLIKDATIIETPTVVQLEAFISNSYLYTDDYIQERVDLPFHYSDLVQKIRIPIVTIQGQFLESYEKIRSIIKGEFRVNQNAGGGIEYLKGNTTIPIKASNVASGIKSFGLLQMLIKSNYISPDKYLIIDEPEVHLHPQWEIEYADIIVELALLGIKIIISSHSPYFLRKIRAAVIANKEVEKITEFYWGQKNTNGKSKFEKVTNNPEAAFKALAEAMSSTAYPTKN